MTTQLLQFLFGVRRLVAALSYPRSRPPHHPVRHRVRQRAGRRRKPWRRRIATLPEIPALATTVNRVSDQLPEKEI
jgi:hypothetical protein